MAYRVRWGIIGTGGIAGKFAEGLALAAGAELTAVGSRTQENADRFAQKYNVPHSHSSYEALARDADVDAVYVATPHPMHKGDSMLALKAGKAVLCEKPFTVSAAEARQVIALARKKKLFLMEAMWTRFIPSIVKLRELLGAGAIGQAQMILANFGFDAGGDLQRRHLNAALAGGALLDVGVYPISLASMLFGGAIKITGLAHLGETGVDERAGVVGLYEGGRVAVMSTAVRTKLPFEAGIYGDEGHIDLDVEWWKGQKLTVCRKNEPPQVIDASLTGNGYNYEAEEVARCLEAGKTESDVMPLDETLAIVATMDELRAQWGLKYPME